MPPKIKITKEEIIKAAFELVREEGESALSARSIASKLACSTQPIFSNFSDMRELRTAVIGEAWRFYCGKIDSAMGEGKYPPFKAGGMAYIRFAVEEQNLFKLLFMRDRISDGDADDNPDVENVISAIIDSTGLSREMAKSLHSEMWIFVHGLAVMFATRFSEYNEERISYMLSDVYFALLERYKNKPKISDIERS